MSYLPCELHCHSVHSDGDYTVCELQKKAIDDHLAQMILWIGEMQMQII